MKTGIPRADWTPEPLSMKRAMQLQALTYVIPLMLLCSFCIPFLMGFDIPIQVLSAALVLFVAIVTPFSPYRFVQKRHLRKLRESRGNAQALEVAIDVKMNDVHLGSDVGFISLHGSGLSFVGLRTSFSISKDWEILETVGSCTPAATVAYLVRSDSRMICYSVRVSLTESEREAGSSLFERLKTVVDGSNPNETGEEVEPPTSFNHEVGVERLLFAPLIAMSLVCVGVSVWSIFYGVPVISFIGMCLLSLGLIVLSCWVVTGRRREYRKYLRKCLAPPPVAPQDQVGKK